MTTAELPYDVDLLARQRGLGDFRSSFAAHKRVRRLVGFGLFLLIAVVLAVVVTLSVYGGTRPSKFPEIVYVFWGLVGLALLPFLHSMWNSPLISARARRRQFHAFAEGYVQVAAQGPIAHRWDEVVVIFQEITYIKAMREYWLDIAFSDGTKTKLTTFSTDMENFAPLLQCEIARVQLPKARQHLQGGQRIEFGDFSVTSGGVSPADGSEVPWSEVREVALIDEEFGQSIRLKRHGKWLAVSSRPAKTIPNLCTFVTLASELAQEAHST